MNPALSPFNPLMMPRMQHPAFSALSRQMWMSANMASYRPRPRLQYSQSQITAAILDVEMGKSISKAARDNGVPFTSLYRKVKAHSLQQTEDDPPPLPMEESIPYGEPLPPAEPPSDENPLPAAEPPSDVNPLPAEELASDGNTLPAEELTSDGNTLPAGELTSDGNPLPAEELLSDGKPFPTEDPLLSEDPGSLQGPQS